MPSNKNKKGRVKRVASSRDPAPPRPHQILYDNVNSPEAGTYLQRGDYKPRGGGHSRPRGFRRNNNPRQEAPGNSYHNSTEEAHPQQSYARAAQVIFYFGFLSCQV